jgi:hypothetical protein
MFDDANEEPTEKPLTAADRAKEKTDEFRTHAELAAVFEGCRKFDAQIIPGLDAGLALDVQRTFAKLEKSKSPESPVLPNPSAEEARRILQLCDTRELSTNDYHIHRRPGEVIIVRWLEGEQVETFYERLQAHFDAALAGFKDDERQSQGWKQDPDSQAFMAALDGIAVSMVERYLREIIRKHRVFVLSTQAADELNIAYLADYVMEVPITDIVGRASAPPEEPSEHDLAWFFKLFSLRGFTTGVERMCFFTFLQKSDNEME